MVLQFQNNNQLSLHSKIRPIVFIRQIPPRHIDIIAMSTPMWEHAIRLNVVNLKHCVVTENFQYLHASKAQDVHRMLHATQSLAVTESQVIEDIKAIETKQAENTEQIMASFTQSVRSLPETDPNPNDWERRINEQREKAKQQAIDGIDGAADVIIEKIRKLPPAERNGAADVYIKASNFVMGVVEVLVQKMTEVAGEIAEFFKGIWKGLTKAYDAVADAAKSAVNAIRGIFGLMIASGLDDQLNDRHIAEKGTNGSAVGVVA